MEKLNEIWQMIAPYVTNTTVMAVIMAVVTAVIKGSINKKFNLSDMSNLFNKSFDKTISQVKEMTFTHDIQPLVDSALMHYNEQANADMKHTIANQNEILKLQTMAISQLIHFFDNSVNISPEQIGKAQEIIDKTIELCDVDKPIVVQSTIVLKDEKEEKPEVAVNIER